MLRPALRLPLLLLCIGLSPLASASSDTTCTPRWQLDASTLDGCSSLPFFSPANDSRINLLWLLADRGLRLQVPPLDASDPHYAGVPFDLHRLLPWPEYSYPDNPEDERPQDELDRTLAAQIARLGLNAEFGKRFQPEPYPLGEGSLCHSNSRQTASDFLARLEQPGLSNDEQRLLGQRRLQLLAAGCISDAAAALPLQAELAVSSPLAHSFASYLRGSAAFYREDFAAASGLFSAAAASGDAWLREAARYMQARNALNAAQREVFDDWGSFDPQKADRAELQRAEDGFKAYLAEWPQGRYAASARGLLRKVYWLRQDFNTLADSYAALFSQPLEATQASVLISEIDNKLLLQPPPLVMRDPLLLAIHDLMYMRPAEGDYVPMPLTELQAQQPLFASQPALFAYLLAAHQLFVGQNAAAALQALPADDGKPLDYQGFSRETLRGLALETLGKHDEARAHWLALGERSQQPLQRDQLQLALALNLERSDRLAEVFAAGSPVQAQPIRDQLLSKVADAALLRERVSSQSADAPLALYNLLYKQLNFGKYAEFLQDLPLLEGQPLQQELRERLGGTEWTPERQLAMFRWNGTPGRNGYDCPTLGEVAGLLQRNNRDPHGLLCLGEFVRQHKLEEVPLDTEYAEPPAASSLGATPPRLSGQNFSRLQAYQQVMADQNASPAQRAYATFRAVHCFAPAGYNGCDGQEIPQPQRREWFQTLKKRYAGTPWAQQLRIYW